MLVKMLNMKKYFDFSNIRGDLFGGLTAGIVALPLALAFGEQSGLGAAAGLYGAAFIAFFAALFGGTPSQISGPTAPMTALSMVIIASLFQAYPQDYSQALAVILMVFLLAGLFQILFGILKIGMYIKYIPYTVVSGFMSGIGVIILITQIPPLLGYYSANDEEIVKQMRPQAEQIILNRILVEDAHDDVLVLQEFNEAAEHAKAVTEQDIREESEKLAARQSKGVYGAIKTLPNALRHINWIEFILAISTIIIIYGFKRITKFLPSTLVALLVVSGVAYGFGLDYVLIQEIPKGLPFFHSEIFTSFDFFALAPFFLTALMLSLLGAIDSLLTSVVADNMTKTQHKPNQELIGQGIGNSIAAFFGGLPGAGATIRTVVNIQSGGKTKISGMVSGILLFLILISLGPVASKIPAAVLAGILITVGIGVMDYRGLKALPKMEPHARVILLTVLLLTVFWQLVYAVVIGLIISTFIFLKRMADNTAQAVAKDDMLHNPDNEFIWADEDHIPIEIRERIIIERLSGPLFFGMSFDFRNKMAELIDLKVLVIRMKYVPFIDQSGVFALADTITDLRKRGVLVLLTGLGKQVSKRLHRMNILPDLVKEEHTFESLHECAEFLRNLLEHEGLELELKKQSEPSSSA